MASSIRTHDPSGATSRSGLRRHALAGDRWLLVAFLLAGAAPDLPGRLGAFSLQEQGLEAARDTAFAPHRDLGFTMAGIALVILLLVLIARRAPARSLARPCLALLTSLMQSLLAGLGEDDAVYGALHALDGLLILGLAGYLYARAWRQKS